MLVRRGVRFGNQSVLAILLLSEPDLEGSGLPFRIAAVVFRR